MCLEAEYKKPEFKGQVGIFPEDVAKNTAFGKYSLEYYDVSCRIVRMNKRLYHETGDLLFEKTWPKWALTRFAFAVYDYIDTKTQVRDVSQALATEGSGYMVETNSYPLAGS